MTIPIELLGRRKAATEQVAATIKESTRTLDELTRLADNLNHLVARFTI